VQSIALLWPMRFPPLTCSICHEELAGDVVIERDHDKWLRCVHPACQDAA